MRLLSIILSSRISNLQASSSASQDPCMPILPMLLPVSLEDGEPQVPMTTPGSCGSYQCLPFPFSVQCTKTPVPSTLHKPTNFSKYALCVFTHHTYPCLFWLLFTYLTSHSLSNTAQFSLGSLIAVGSLHSFPYSQTSTGSCINHLYTATVLHTCLSGTSSLWRGLFLWSDQCCCLSAPFSSCLAGSSACISSIIPLLLYTPLICPAHSYPAYKMYTKHSPLQTSLLVLASLHTASATLHTHTPVCSPTHCSSFCIQTLSPTCSLCFTPALHSLHSH